MWSVMDGSKEIERRAERVLTTDAGLGVVRHADAGYESAGKVRERSISKCP